MSARSFLVGSLLLAACRHDDSPVQSQPVRVAAAADLSVAFKEVGAAFEAKTGKKVSFSYGASGLLAKQVSQGAPFDVFAAANVSYVDDAVKSGECLGDTKKTYAQGHLVMWAKDKDKLPKSLEELRDPKFTKISIAHPEHAPYGKAARQALEKAGVWDDVHKRLVLGENVQQTLQFAQTGNADVTITALSLALTAGGPYVSIDTSMHDPLDQAMVVCKGGPGGGKTNEAKQFEEFVGSPDGRAIMRKHGFLLPGDPVPSK